MKRPVSMRIDGGMICSWEGWDGWMGSQVESRVLESAEDLCHQSLGRHEGGGNEDAAGGSGGRAYGIRELGSLVAVSVLYMLGGSTRSGHRVFEFVARYARWLPWRTRDRLPCSEYLNKKVISNLVT